MLYEYRCKQCGAPLEAYRKIDDRHLGPTHCGQMARLEIRTAPYGFVDNMEEYWCPVTNQGVTTRGQRNDIMDRNYLIDANDLLRTDEERNKVQAEWDAKREKLSADKPQVVQEYVDREARKELNL